MSLYVKLVSNWYRDPKIVQAGRDARELYLASLGLAKDENSDGFIAEEQLRFLDIDDDGVPAMRARAARLVDVGLWEPANGGWHIVAWFKHNVAKDAQLSEKRSSAGKAGADARWRVSVPSSEPDGNLPSMANGNAVVAMMANATTTTTTGSGSGVAMALAVEGGSGGDGQEAAGTVPAAADELPVAPASAPAVPPGDPPPVPGNGHASAPEPATESAFQPVPGWEPPEAAPGQPDWNDGEFEPTDPEYAYDHRWQGEDLLALWEKRLGRIQPGQLAKAQFVLSRLHNYHRLSKRQLRAMVQHCISDPKARKFWGTGRSPAIWLDAKGSERVWQRVLSHLTQSGWSLPDPDPERALPVIQAGPTRPPMPARDPTCDCPRTAGWLSIARKIPCPKCELGKWIATYEVPQPQEAIS